LALRRRDDSDPFAPDRKDGLIMRRDAVGCIAERGELALPVVAEGRRQAFN
jgi:hypothetical protein